MNEDRNPGAVRNGVSPVPTGRTFTAARGVAMRRVLVLLLFALSETVPIVLVQPHPASAATHTITINGAPYCGTSLFCYSPSSLTVTAGDSVTWVNNSPAPHTVTRCTPSACSGSGRGRSSRQRGPSSPTIKASGGMFTFTFTRPGKYRYYSAIDRHGTLHGRILVVPAPSTTTPGPGTTSTTVASGTTTSALTRAAATRQLTGAFTYTVAIDGTSVCGTSMFCYNPSAIAVNPGDTVDWVNNSTAPQTITRCGPFTCSGNGPGGGGQSGPSSPTIDASGGTFSFTFTSAGTYNYFCAICGFAMMQGTITVEPGAATITTGMKPTTVASSSMNVRTMRVLSAASGPSSRGLGPAAASGSANQLGGTGNSMSRGITAALVFLLLALGVTAVVVARRRRNAQRACVAAPKSSLTISLLEDGEAERTMQNPTRT
jgi:plastocyanin